MNYYVIVDYDVEPKQTLQNYSQLRNFADGIEQ